MRGVCTKSQPEYPSSTIFIHLSKVDSCNTISPFKYALQLTIKYTFVLRPSEVYSLTLKLPCANALRMAENNDCITVFSSFFKNTQYSLTGEMLDTLSNLPDNSSFLHGQQFDAKSVEEVLNNNFFSFANCLVPRHPCSLKETHLKLVPSSGQRNRQKSRIF